MKTRYYVVFVQHNKEANAENRTVPSAFDTINEALQKFHEQMGNDMKNKTLDWSVGFILDSTGGLLQTERWNEEKEVPGE